MKPRLLWYADSPTAASGFGNVSRGLLQHLVGRFDVTVFGINESGLPHPWPFHIIPAEGRSHLEVYGRHAFLAHLEDAVRYYDLVFMLQDSFVLASPLAGGPTFIERVAALCRMRATSLVAYFPIDARPERPWLEAIERSVDLAATYTRWGQALCEEALPGFRPIVMPHGCDPDEFVPASPALRKELRSRLLPDPDAFWILYVGQNQQRKILDWVLICYRELLRKVPRARLLLHTQPESSHGWDLVAVARQLDLDPGLLTFSAMGLEREDLLERYQAADCLLLPSAEGWGLSSTEAFAAGCPAVLGGHASLAEIGGDGRALLIATPEDDPNLMYVDTRDNDVLRRRPDVKDAVEKLAALASGAFDPRFMVKKARAWIEDLAWEGIADHWARAFAELIALQRARSLEGTVEKAVP